MTAPTTPRHRWFQFSLSRLAFSVALFAVSFGALQWIMWIDHGGYSGNLGLGFIFLMCLFLWLSAFACAGAAVGILFCRWRLGAFVGVILGIAVLIWFANQPFPNDPPL